MVKFGYQHVVRALLDERFDDLRIDWDGSSQYDLVDDSGGVDNIESDSFSGLSGVRRGVVWLDFKCDRVVVKSERVVEVVHLGDPDALAKLVDVVAGAGVN